MHTAITTAFHGSAVVSAALLIQLAGCSRVDITGEPSRTEFSTPEPVRQSPAKRIAQIERELAAPLSGKAGEADDRKVLRAELANLRATYGWQDRSAAYLQYANQLQQLQQSQRQQQQLQSQYNQSQAGTRTLSNGQP